MNAATANCPTWCTSHRFPNPTGTDPRDDLEWHEAKLFTEPFELTLKEDVWPEGWEVPDHMKGPILHFETATGDDIFPVESAAAVAASIVEAARRIEGLVSA